MNAMLDAMEQMKRRTAKLVGFYNEQRGGGGEAAGGGGGPVDGFVWFFERTRRGSLGSNRRARAAARGERVAAGATGEGVVVVEAGASSGRRGGGVGARAVEEAVRRTGSFDSLDGDGADAKLTRSIRDSIGSVNGC